jgi:hypothetical protein
MLMATMMLTIRDNGQGFSIFKNGRTKRLLERYVLVEISLSAKPKSEVAFPFVSSMVLHSEES